jgi:hypothetical protein
VAFLSKFLDPVTRDGPKHIQEVAAIALLTKESRKITFVGDLITSNPHQVRTILNQKVGRWLTYSRILKYEAILLEKDDLTLTTDEVLNPVTFLAARQEGGAPKHKCLDIIEYQTKVRPDLGETPFQTGFHFFVDGSSRVIEGKRHNGYSTVDGEAMTIIESGRLPNNWSAQTCELFALNQASKHLKDKEGTIYTNSKYAFGVVHTFGKIWMEQGLINSKGQDLVHGELIQQILGSLKLPEEIAIAMCQVTKRG